jgi:predicted DNA-binding transcriptional regulator AlpA
MSNEISSRQLIDWKAVQARVGNISNVTAWRMRRKKLFPEPVRITPGRVAWYADEIDAWIASRSSERAA